MVLSRTAGSKSRSGYPAKQRCQNYSSIDTDVSPPPRVSNDEGDSQRDDNLILKDDFVFVRLTFKVFGCSMAYDTNDAIQKHLGKGSCAHVVYIYIYMVYATPPLCLPPLEPVGPRPGPKAPNMQEYDVLPTYATPFTRVSPVYP